jgi:hypothetical protein
MKRASRMSGWAAAAGAFATLLTGIHAANGQQPPCNPYFPLTPGARWVYREGMVGSSNRLERKVTVTQARREGDVLRAQLDQTVNRPGGTVGGSSKTEVECKGGRISMVLTGTAEAKSGSSRARGSVIARLPGLPPASELVPGHQWRSQSEIEASEQGTKVITHGTRENRVESVGAVEVPAGRFPDAVKILAIETLKIAGKDPRTARQEFVEWYARGIGLVKRETRVRRGEHTAVSTELLESFSP